jgi:hypothetical protein
VLLVCSVLAAAACGGAQPEPAHDPSQPAKKPPPPELVADDPGLRRDLVLPGASSAMLVDLGRARELGLGAIARLALRENQLAALDAIELVCGIDPLAHIGRVIFTDKLVGAWVTGVELVDSSTEDALDCLARAAPGAQARALGARPALQLTRPDVLVTDVDGALLFGSEQGLMLALGLTEASNDVDAAMVDAFVGPFGTAEVGRALERIDTRRDTLVSAGQTSFFDLTLLVRHEGEGVTVRISAGANELTAAGISPDLDVEIRRGVTTLVQEAGKFLGDEERARELLGPLQSAELVHGGDRLELAFALPDLAAIGQAGEAAQKRAPAYEARRRLEDWATMAGARYSYLHLCESAQDVPAEVPGRAGATVHYEDWSAGWLCQGFSVDGPVYHRYSYRVRGGYKGPARGGPDPGPTGFELAAESDFDGDGMTGLITVTGHVDASGQLVVDPTFQVDELE